MKRLVRTVLELAAFVIAYIVLSVWVLPRLGVPT